MALAPDSPAEELKLSSETLEAAHPDLAVSSETDHRTEIPALLGKDEIPEPGESGESVFAGDCADAGSEPHHERAESQPFPETAVETAIHIGTPPVSAADIQLILETVQESLTNTAYISAKIDAVSGDTDALLQQLKTLSTNQERLATQVEEITANVDSKNSGSTNVPSKTFLIASSSLLAMLVVAQVYLFISLLNTQRHQNTAGSAVLGNITSLNKKMALYDTNLTKALAQPATQEHTQPPPSAGHETAGGVVSASAPVVPVLERLNKLRNGLPEKKLVRKESGDWYIYSKKNDECIADVEVIKALNQAYERTGRSLTPPVPMPSHNALCILKADGKGGTQIVMTKEFLP